MCLPAGTVPLEGHSDCHWVNRIAVVEEKNLLVTSCLGGKQCREMVRVYDSFSGKLMLNFTEHESFVLSIVVIGAPDLLATGDCGGVLCIWRASTGKCLYRCKHGGDGLWSIAVMDSSRFVVGTGNGSLIFFGHHEGDHVIIMQTLKGAHEKLIRSISICKSRMVTCSVDRTAKAWDIETLKEMGVMRGHEGDWQGVATDGKYIVTTTGYEGENLALNAIYVWDAETICLLRVFGVKHGNKIISVTLLGQTHVLTASVDRTLLLTEISTGNSADPISLPFPILGAAVTNDGRIAVCGKEEAAVIFPPPPAYSAAIAAEMRHRKGGPSGGERPDLATTCAARITALKEGGVSADVVSPMNDDEIAELIAAYLIGFNQKHVEYFTKLKRSIAESLSAAGVFAGNFLVGKRAESEDQGLVKFVVDQLEKDGLVRITSESMLLRFLEILRE